MFRKFWLFFLSLFSSSGGVATRDSILSAPDRIAGFIDVPEWGGRIYIATLTVAQRARFLEGLTTFSSKAAADRVGAGVIYFRLQVELLASAVVGADSEPLFVEADIEKLITKSPVIVGKVFDSIVELNGFSSVATEEAAKN